MFHLFNKVYLEYDFKFEQTYPYIVASERWTTHPMIVTKSEAKFLAPSFEELLTKNFNSDMEKFWEYLYKHDEKLIIYVDVNTFNKLIITYWKSIFDKIPLNGDLHFLHKTYIESVRLMNYYGVIGQWDISQTKSVRSNIFNEINFLDQVHIDTISNGVKISNFLRNEVSKRKISFEYLLMDYFADKATPYKDELLDRVKFLTWDNWLDELEHLKYEILSGNIDAKKIDPTINTKVGNVEEELKKSDILKWTVDPQFGKDANYIRINYDYKIFDQCWTKWADAWGVPYDDMDELNEMINTDQYENLLMRDINRGFGSSYTRTRFMTKANQVLTTWAYDLIRNNQTGELSKFKLKR